MVTVTTPPKTWSGCAVDTYPIDMIRERIVYRPLPGATQQQARDARARAWAYIFECFHRHEGEGNGSTIAAPDDAERSISEIGADSRVP